MKKKGYLYIPKKEKPDRAGIRKKFDDTKEFISKTPSPLPSPLRGEDYNSSPPLRGGDEGEGDLGFAEKHIISSQRSDRSTDNEEPEFHEGQSVELLIGDRTDIGYNALINNSCEGLLYKNEVFQALRKGDHISGFIKKVREDGKIDLCLQKPGAEKVYDVAGKIIEVLNEQGGFIALDDKTPPEVIYNLFGTSKKTYKKAIGALYKKRLILIENDGIRLVKET